MSDRNERFIRGTLDRAVRTGRINETERSKWAAKLARDPVATAMDLAGPKRATTSARPEPVRPKSAKPKKPARQKSKTRTQGTGLLPELRDRSTTAANPRERDRIVNDAIKAGKIAKSERSRYKEMYDRDPVSTRLLLSKLTGCPPPVTAARRRSGTGLLKELDR
ncbi:MAG TPA: hypothetical protein VK506_09935 [Conexibacter sp.]|nr:hypothetical protein [Conexibacter sp.]